MSIDRDTLANLAALRNAEVESARLALAEADRRLADARRGQTALETALAEHAQRRRRECRRFDRRVEQIGASVAEIALFEERLDGLMHEEQAIEAERRTVVARVDQLASAVEQRRERLNECLAAHKVIEAQRAAADRRRERRAERDAWDEREAVAARKIKEER